MGEGPACCHLRAGCLEECERGFRYQEAICQYCCCDCRRGQQNEKEENRERGISGGFGEVEIPHPRTPLLWCFRWVLPSNHDDDQLCHDGSTTYGCVKDNGARRQPVGSPLDFVVVVVSTRSSSRKSRSAPVRADSFSDGHKVRQYVNGSCTDGTGRGCNAWRLGAI